MKIFSKHLGAMLLLTAFISSCSRPVAYFQPTSREYVKSAQPVAVEANQAALVAESAPAQPITTVEQTEPVAQVAQAKEAIRQLETYVRNDNKLASNKKVAKRMARVSELLVNSQAQTASATKTVATQKTTLLQRMMLKKMDKKIKNHLSPEQPMAKSMLTIGAIVAIIGLVLLLLNVASPLGIIALVVGLILILIDLLR